MMLDAKAPKFSMRGRVADIVPAAYELKRRKLLAGYLKQRARRAQRRAVVAMVALLVVAFVLQACAPAIFNSLSTHEEEQANPNPPRQSYRPGSWYWVD